MNLSAAKSQTQWLSDARDFFGMAAAVPKLTQKSMEVELPGVALMRFLCVETQSNIPVVNVGVQLSTNGAEIAIPLLSFIYRLIGAAKGGAFLITYPTKLDNEMMTAQRRTGVPLIKLGTLAYAGMTLWSGSRLDGQYYAPQAALKGFSSLTDDAYRAVAIEKKEPLDVVEAAEKGIAKALGG